MLTNLISLFFVFYLILYTPKGAVNVDLLSFLGKMMEYDFYIVIVGLGFITGEGMVTILAEKAKAVAVSTAQGPPNIKTDNIEQVNVVKDSSVSTTTTFKEPSDVK